MATRKVTLRTVCGTAAALSWAALPALGPIIRVSPHILVSRIGDASHCETMIAADPKDAKNVHCGVEITRFVSAPAPPRDSQ
jgi:hypothetical protein